MDKQLLIFDFNGVISYNYFWQDIYIEEHPLFARRQELNDFIFKQNTELVREWMVGKYTAEEVHDLIEKELGITKEYLFPIFIKGAMEIDISHVILQEIQKKRNEGYFTALLTDNMDSFPRFTRPSNKILDESFDKIYDSFSTKLLKKQNNGEAFLNASNDFHIPLHQITYFDDSEGNCNLFQSLGGNSRHVTTEPRVVEAIRLLP